MSVIEVKDVKKSFGSGTSKVDALKGINFTAEKGEVAIIIGPSGSGKSTFLTIAGSLQTPTSGSVKIDNTDISTLTEKQRGALRLNKIGFVLQAYNLVPFLTVKEQFDLVDRVKKTDNMGRDKLTDLLEQLEITNLIHKYPSELSGGQQQRVAIARALYANPEMVLADEPTAALDSSKVEEVGSLFEKLAKDSHKAIVLVTHDMRLLKYADKVYKIMDGEITLEAHEKAVAQA